MDLIILNLKKSSETFIWTILVIFNNQDILYNLKYNYTGCGSLYNTFLVFGKILII